jgi:hypothetical protein
MPSFSLALCLELVYKHRIGSFPPEAQEERLPTKKGNAMLLVLLRNVFTGSRGLVGAEGKHREY